MVYAFKRLCRLHRRMDYKEQGDEFMGCCGPGKGGSGDGGKGIDLGSPQAQQGVLMGCL